VKASLRAHIPTFIKQTFISLLQTFIMCCINSANIASGYLTMPPKINPTPLEINPNTHTQTNSGFLETSDILIPIPHYHQFCCSWGITVTPAAQML
jgi:hypothetical protein